MNNTLLLFSVASAGSSIAQHGLQEVARAHRANWREGRKTDVLKVIILYL
jgi:hypothetical protein